MSNYLTKTLCIALLATPAISLLQAQTNTQPLVNWEGNYLLNNYQGNLYMDRGTPVAVTDGVLYPHSPEKPKSPKHANYDLNSPSATFYGAFQATTTKTDSIQKNRMQVRYAGGRNCLTFVSDDSSPGHTVTIEGLVFWDQKDFLNASKTQDTVPLSTVTTMVANILAVRGKAEMRFAVLAEGKWYLSSESLMGDSAGPQTLPLGEFALRNPAEIFWGEWHVTDETSPLPKSPMNYETSGRSLQKISAVGLYFNSRYTASNSALVEVDSFKVLTGAEK